MLAAFALTILLGCGAGAGGDDLVDDAAVDAAPRWPTGALDRALGHTYVVAFDDRGRELLRRNLTADVTSAWRYEGDFLAESSVTVAGAMRDHYLAEFVGGLPQTATETHGSSAYQYTWTWDTSGSLPQLRTLVQVVPGNRLVSTYERNVQGYDRVRCGSSSCERLRYIGPVDYLGGPDHWTELFTIEDNGAAMLIGRATYDANGLLLSRDELFAFDPSQNIYETWTRAPDGPPSSYAWRNGAGFETALEYTFD